MPTIRMSAVKHSSPTGSGTRGHATVTLFLAYAQNRPVQSSSGPQGRTKHLVAHCQVVASSHNLSARTINQFHGHFTEQPVSPCVPGASRVTQAGKAAVGVMNAQRRGDLAGQCAITPTLLGLTIDQVGAGSTLLADDNATWCGLYGLDSDLPQTAPSADVRSTHSANGAMP
jgi:hypothetical protein